MPPSPRSSDPRRSSRSRPGAARRAGGPDSDRRSTPVADQHLVPDGQGSRERKAIPAVDTMTGFYARFGDVPSQFWNDPPGGQQSDRFPARRRLPSGAIIVGTVPTIAIRLQLIRFQL